MRKNVLALAVGLLLGTASMSMAVIPTSPPTDPTTSGIIGRVNQYLGSLLSLSANTGELQFFASQSWARNDTVATTMTSLGPQGSHTTVQEWLVVVNNAGVVRYIPAY